MFQLSLFRTRNGEEENFPAVLIIRGWFRLFLPCSVFIWIKSRKPLLQVHAHLCCRELLRRLTLPFEIYKKIWIVHLTQRLTKFLYYPFALFLCFRIHSDYCLKIEWEIIRWLHKEINRVTHYMNNSIFWRDKEPLMSKQCMSIEFKEGAEVIIIFSCTKFP